MQLEQRSEREFAFYSRGGSSGKPVIFKARYRGLGPTRKLAEIRSGTLEYFLTERYCLFSSQPRGTAGPGQSAPCSVAAGRGRGGDRAQRSAGVDRHSSCRTQEPVLHYSRRLAVYVWPAELVRARPADGQRDSGAGHAVGLEQLRQIPTRTNL